MPRTIFRIHEPPDPERVGELSDTLAALGLRFRPKKITPASFQHFLQSVEGRADEQMISFVVLRSFRQAVYSTRNVGHFGLASTCYTHFTSPIRRYPDLVVHRLLKAYLTGNRRSGYIPAELEAVASRASSRERIAEMAERDLFNWKRMILLERHLGDTLDAVVTSVLGRGIRVELVDHFIEGFVGVDDMDDDYEFDARSRTLVGRGTRRRYRLGQRIAVRVARIDKLIGRAYFMGCTTGL
jgi:ribonuclease R